MLDEDGLPLPIDAVDPGITQFRDADAGGIQEIHQRLVPRRPARVPQVFQLDTLHGFARGFFLADGGDAPDRIDGTDAFQNAPFKETAENPARVADRCVLVAVAFADGKIVPDVRGGNGCSRHTDGEQEAGQDGTVQFERSGGLFLDGLCINEHGQDFRIWRQIFPAGSYRVERGQHLAGGHSVRQEHGKL